MSFLINDNTLKYQSGVFTIELALVSSLMVLFLAFASDMVSKQTMQGHLQRLSYSAVSIIKERTQLYQKDAADEDAIDKDVIDKTQVNQLNQIIQHSMRRTTGGYKDTSFGMMLEQLKFKRDDSGSFQADYTEPFFRGMQGCVPDRDLSSYGKELLLVTSWGNGATIYQVTLCYKGDNWFGSLVGEDYSTVKASSLMLGR